MANEAKKVELTNSTGFPRRFTIADATAITKGTLMVFSDPRTAVASSGGASTALAAAGIAMEGKDASDGTVTFSVWTDGIFDLVASGAIVAGNPIVFVYGNCVAVPPSTASGAIIAGYAMETATADERIQCRIRI